MKSTEPKKPKSVPAEATYDADSQEWGLGALDKKGNPSGEWRYWWHSTGHLCCISNYEDGGRKNTFTRLHPDGTYSWKGIEIGGKPMPGEVIHYQKSKKPTTELALSGSEYAHVFRVEETFIRRGLSKWKNFDAKGRRIELDGTLIPQLDVKRYAKNFGRFQLPALLSKLVEFQNDVGIEMFANGFALQEDDKGLFKGIATTKQQKTFLDALLPIGSANGTGSVYAVWNNGSSKKVEALPVVIFGDEGGVHVVAQNLVELLAIVAADVEPSVDEDGVTFDGDSDPSPEISAYREWLAAQGIKVAKPAATVRKAQKRFEAAFSAWVSSLKT